MNRGSGLRIGRILGIPIYLHSTWVFIFAAITYMIASQFKQQHPLWTDAQHWTVGVLTSLLFFASVLFHELSHSVVAQSSPVLCTSELLAPSAPNKGGGDSGSATPSVTCLNVSGFFVMSREYG